MKIDIAEQDLLHLRNLIEQVHDQIDTYPVVKNPSEQFEGVRDQFISSQQLLRKIYRKLCRALTKSSIGHDCNPTERMQAP